MPGVRPGWDDEHDKFGVLNLLGLCFLLATSWACCATWFPLHSLLFFCTLFIVFGILAFAFFKSPTATFIVALALCVAVIAHPYPLTNQNPSPSTSYDNIINNINNNNYNNNNNNNNNNNKNNDYNNNNNNNNNNPKQPETNKAPPSEEKYTPPTDFIDYKSIKEVVKEPEISVDDIILGPGVQVTRGSRPTITISGGGIICENEVSEVSISFDMTGTGPWQFAYYREGEENVKFTSSKQPFHKVQVDKPGIYKLANQGEDSVCGIYDVHGEAVVTLHKSPSIQLKNTEVEICEGETATIEGELIGSPPFTVSYHDGSRILAKIFTNSKFQLQSTNPTTYTIVSISDSMCKSPTLDVRATISVISLPSITLTGGKCEGDDIVLTANGQPPFSLELNFPFSLSPSDPPSHSLSLPSHSLTIPSSSLLENEREGQRRGNKKLMFRLKRDNQCEAGRDSVQLAEVHQAPTATLRDFKKIVKQGEQVVLEISLTGTAPWDLWYQSPIGIRKIKIDHSPHLLLHQEEGKYTLMNVSDAYCKNSAQGSAEILTFTAPSVQLSPLDNLCQGSTASIRMDFSGKPPFTFRYSFAGDQFTNTTSFSSATFTTTKSGTFRLEEFHDFFNYTVKQPPSQSREVKFVKPPTYSVKSPQFTCDHAEMDVTISFDGNGPFSLEYLINQTVHTKHDLSSSLSMKLPTPTLLTIQHLKDRFGCDAITNQITNEAADEAVLHFPSKAVPDLDIAGGGCHPVSLRFQGVPPFVLDYSFSESGDGSNSRDISREFTDFSVFLSDTGSYTFHSLSDSYCKRQLRGIRRDVLELPKAELEIPNSNFKVCEVEPRSPKNEQLNVLLRGSPPFDVTLLTPEGATEITEIKSNKYSQAITTSGSYEILKVNDANCRGTVLTDNKTKKTVTIDYHTTPTVAISGGGEICQGESVELKFQMTGNGPWDVSFTNGKFSPEFHSITRDYMYKISTNMATYNEKSGNYRVTNVVDSTCKGKVNPDSESVDVLVRPLPTARVHGGGVVCQGEETVLKISLTGTPPWSLSIARNTSDHKITLADITETELEVKTDEPGFFYIDFIQDRYCKYRRMNVPAPPR